MFSFAIFIGLLLIFELILRLFLYISLNTYLSHEISDDYRENMIQIVLGPTPYEFDPVTYFLPKGGLFRGPESQISYPEKKSNDEIRIICIGDSTTYASLLIMI